MSYDYAKELLEGGGSDKPIKSTPHDYAKELLEGFKEKPYQPTGRPEFDRGMSFKTLPIQNRDSFSGTADFRTLTKAASVDDPATKIRIFANDLFPGDKKAAERFGIVDGEVVYIGKDEKLYRATPPGFLGSVQEFGANMAGNALPIVGGVAGSVLGAPGGPAGSLGLSALGAAGGKGIQQVIANTVYDEPQTVGGNIAGMGQEAAFDVGGSLIGLGLQKWLSRNVLRDAGKLDPEAVRALDLKSRNVGGTGLPVDLNVAQRTNIPSLKGRAEALARIPDSADEMNAALDATRGQAARAAGAFVDGVGTATSVRSGGEAGRTGATNILDRIAEDRAAAAKPWYDKALNKIINLSDEGLSKLANTPAFKSAFERGQKIAANEGLDLGQSASNMRALHYVKLGLDDLIEKGGLKEGVGSTERRTVIGVKNKLLEFMDAASPDYARARSIYGHYMPSLKAGREGLIGELAELADKDLIGAARRVFSPTTSPEDVVKLRSMFYRYDQGERWKDLLKGFLQDTLETSSREFKSGPGVGAAVSWRAQLMGNPKQAANLRAAMTEKQFSAFTDMMDVFEAVGRVQGRGNSITMQMQEAASNLRAESGRNILQKILEPKRAVVDWIAEARMGRHASKQVEILNDPNGIKRLNELKKLSPHSKEFIQGFSSLFGLSLSPESKGDVPLN